MNCPQCGEVCCCQPEPPPAQHASRKPDEEIAAGAGDTSAVANEAEDPNAWRGELAARLNRYRARRKVRPPRYPSLNLPFETAPTRVSSRPDSEFNAHPYEVVSDQALALNEMRPEPSEAGAGDAAAGELPAPSRATVVASAGAKIIEFPRFAWSPPPPPEDQLAEPVSDVPRILDVPETAPAPPALGGITIEPAEKAEVERRPGIDLPLQSASLSRRLAASLLDGMIVALATGLFGYVFWKIAKVIPPRIEAIALGAGFLVAFWFAYQYLLIVYGATTPGLRITSLELTHFDGAPTRRSTRRWRILASLLSAISLGMGYAWVFLDEDVLCWHDRITGTYLAPANRTPVN